MNWGTKFEERTLTWSCSSVAFHVEVRMHSCGLAPDPHFFRAKTLRSARLPQRVLRTDSEEGILNCNVFHTSALVSDRSATTQVYEKLLLRRSFDKVVLPMLR